MFRSPYADALIVVVVLLLFFGPKRLPAVGRSLGQGMREFKDSISGKSHESEDEQPPELESAPQAPPAQPAEAQPAAVSTQPEHSEPRS
jgi:sec-independent protein translocase protein TatA